jgi:hypothetical protein
VTRVSRRVGQTTLEASDRTCWMNSNGLIIPSGPFRLRLAAVGGAALPEKLAARGLSAPRHLSLI